MVKIGDIFEIPLSNGYYAYGQYIFLDREGPIIQVFDLIAKERPEISEIIRSRLKFPPVITGLFAAIRAGLWKKIGYSKIEDIKHPGFVSTFEDEKTGKARIWFYWNGEKTIRLGPTLPEKYKNLEFLVIWSPYDIIHRIETGEEPFPYRDLILHNQYTPKIR